MGNFMECLCPPTALKFISPTSVHRTSSYSDTLLISSNELPPAEEPFMPKNTTNLSVARSPKAPVIPHGPGIFGDHVDFPFLFNDEIAKWIVNTRFMFIMRGPPGSGKSYISECIRTRFPTAKVCSADDFFYLSTNGCEYQFDVNRVSEAHEWCHANAFNAASSGLSPIVIDNTNVRSWETRYYTDLARRFDYTVIMVSPQTPWRFDAESLALRNVHFVSIETIEAKVRNFEHVFPLYYGWFWPGLPSDLGSKFPNVNQKACKPSPLLETENFLTWGWKSLNTLVRLPQIHQELTEKFGLPCDAPVEQILLHWHSATIPEFGNGLIVSKLSSRPHITAKYARYGKAPGAERYALRSVVGDHLLGSLCTVQVTALVVSSRTVGARIRLPNDNTILRHLWASDDQATLPSNSNNQADFNDFDHESGFGQTQSRPVGCRAHVTLALAPDVSAVETGLDLLRVVDRELNNQPGEHVAIVEDGSVRKVAVVPPPLSPSRSSDYPSIQSPSPDLEYIYVLDLDFPLHYRVLFGGAY